MVEDFPNASDYTWRILLYLWGPWTWWGREGMATGSTFKRVPNLTRVSSHLDQPLPHALRPSPVPLLELREVAFLNPAADPVLQHITRPKPAATHVSH
jgi:hypothetical protein